MTTYKPQKSRTYGGGQKGYSEARPLKSVDRNIAGTNPLSEQFEPTADQPINQHKRMAGTEQ